MPEINIRDITHPQAQALIYPTIASQYDYERTDIQRDVARMAVGLIVGSITGKVCLNSPLTGAAMGLYMGNMCTSIARKLIEDGYEGEEMQQHELARKTGVITIPVRGENFTTERIEVRPERNTEQWIANSNRWLNGTVQLSGGTWEERTQEQNALQLFRGTER
jgi:hypothetical protein